MSPGRLVGHQSIRSPRFDQGESAQGGIRLFRSLVAFAAPISGLSLFGAGQVGLDELTGSFVRRPDVQAFLPKVYLETSDEVDPELPIRSRFTRVTIELTDGTLLESPQVFHARGSAQFPLTHEELWEKFRDCTRARLDEAEAQALFARAQALERLESVAEVLHI